MIICMASSEPSEGEPLTFETAASNICSQLQGRKREDLSQTGKKSIRKRARIVSVKRLTTQQIHRKVFRVFTNTAASCPQPSYVASAHSPYG